MYKATITLESTQMAVLATIAVCVIMSISGVIMLAAARRRRCFLVFLALSSLPLIVGSIGMAIGYDEVADMLSELGEAGAGASVIQGAFARARMPMYIGAGGFGALLILSFAGLLLCKDLCEPKEEAATELVE